MGASEIFGVSDYTFYEGSLTVKGLLVGGVPSDPGVIEAWIRTKLGLKDAALMELVRETMEQRGVSEMNSDEQLEAVMSSPPAPSVNGFKKVDGVLVYESRQLKAAIKEAANSAYPGTQYDGKEQAVKKNLVGARKGLRATLEEEVFVEGQFLSLYRDGAPVTEADRVEERVKHVTGPQGKKSVITRVEVVENPSISFTVKVHDDFLPDKAWGRIWGRLEDIGIGADRARSDGRFELTKWERID